VETCRKHQSHWMAAQLKTYKRRKGSGETAKQTKKISRGISTGKKKKGGEISKGTKITGAPGKLVRKTKFHKGGVIGGGGWKR